MELKISELAEKLGAELIGSGDNTVKGVGAVADASKGQVTFLTDKKHQSSLKDTKAVAVITAEKIEGIKLPQLVVKDVKERLIQALGIFAPSLTVIPQGIDAAAKIARDTQIADTARIGPYVTIEKNAVIGANTIISAGSHVGENSEIESNCRIGKNVVIYHNCRIGKNVSVQANTTIGSTGFGYTQFGKKLRLIPHNGGVIIRDDVEIGANCSIDRAKFGNTIIGEGTKIDNLVQIAHNVTIGKNCLIVAQVGIAGSSCLGDNVVLGGQVGIADHVEIGANTQIAAQSGLSQNAGPNRKLFGSPAFDIKEALKIIFLSKKLPKLNRQVKQLAEKVKKLEVAKNNKI